MIRFRRSLALVSACGLAALVVAPALAAQQASATSFVGQPVLATAPPLVNEQLVTAQLDASGLANKTSLVNRIVANNQPQQDVKSQTSTVDLRFLNRSGAPEVVGNSVIYPVGGPGQTSVATEARYDKPLPVALHAEYATPGNGAKGIDPDSVNGTSGDMSITYTVTNTSVEKQPITYTNADGVSTTTVQPVFAPFVGTLIAKLAPNVELTSAGTGIVNTTKDGTTSIQWNLLLYPPMGNYQQEMTFKVTGNSLSVPEVLMQAVPVTNDQDLAVGFSSDLLSQSLAGSTKLADALTALDSSTAKLAAGAADLAAGQQQAADGTAAAANGSQGITVGAQELTTGLTGLSNALDEFAGPNGLPKAAASAGLIADKVDELVDAIGNANDPPINPTPPFPTKITLVQAARVAQAATTAIRNLALSGATNEAQALASLALASAQLCAAPSPGCTDLQQGITQVQTAALKSAGVAAALQLLNTQVLAKITEGVIEVSAALKSNSAPSVYSALRELQAKLVLAAKLTQGMAAGSGKLETGAGQLTTASETLTNGLDDLTTGSRALAAGGQDLAAGANQLQTDGTSKMLTDVIASSSDPSMANAYLDAASARANDATPYPPPKGAAGRIAYVYLLETPAPLPGVSPAAIGIAAIALAALTVVVVHRLRRPSNG